MAEELPLSDWPMTMSVISHHDCLMWELAMGSTIARQVVLGCIKNLAEFEPVGMQKNSLPLLAYVLALTALQ